MRQPRACKICNKRYDKALTTWNRIICRDCHSAYQRKYYRSVKAQAHFRSPEYKERHKRQCIASIERSPENFIRVCLKRLRQLPRLRNQRNASTIREVTVTFAYLMQLYKKQKGLCALTKIRLQHKTKVPYSISIDRIDSNFDYIPGNVQLVCQIVNFAKARFSNQDVKNFLAEVVKING